MTTTEVIGIALGLLGAGGIVGTLVGKLFPQRENAAKRRGDRLAELEKARDDDRKVIADIKHDLRLLSDYSHDLREHIVSGQPPPPPDWPEGLRL